MSTISQGGIARLSGAEIAVCIAGVELILRIWDAVLRAEVASKPLDKTAVRCIFPDTQLICYCFQSAYLALSDRIKVGRLRLDAVPIKSRSVTQVTGVALPSVK
jgi:hypothetical protein